MQIKKEFISREIMGETVLVPVGSSSVDYGGLFMLTETASFLWKILPTAESAEELAARLCEEYDIDEANALEDTRQFLSKLQGFGII